MQLTPSLALVGSLQFGISGPLDCHVYAVAGKEGAVLIDAGGGTHTGHLLLTLKADLRTPRVTAVLVTHAHADHFGGAAEIRRLTGCQVFAPEVSRGVIEMGDEEAAGLTKAREQGLYPSDFRLSPCPVDRGLKDGDKLEVAGLTFGAIQVRGHSDDSLCYLIDFHEHRWLFAGDVIFYGGVLGVINAEGSDMSGYREDLHKLGNLGIEGLFPGHGIFTLRDGQRHIDCAIQQTKRGFLPHQIGQGDLIF